MNEIEQIMDVCALPLGGKGGSKKATRIANKVASGGMTLSEAVRAEAKASGEPVAAGIKQVAQNKIAERRDSQTPAQIAGRTAAQVGAIATRPMTAQTTAGRLGQGAARVVGGARAALSGASRIAATPQARDAARRAGEATGRAARSAANLERRLAEGTRNVARRIANSRGFGR